MRLSRSNILTMMPAPLGTTTVNYDRGGNANIIEVLHRNIPRAVLETKTIARHFKGATALDTGRNIWDFLKKEMRYVRDGADQNIKTPSAFLKAGTGDCKTFSLFTLAILYNLGYEPVLRYASYDSNPTPSHVYIYIISNGRRIIIDAVWSAFNSEKKFTNKKDYKMRIRSINGLDDSRFFIGCPGGCNDQEIEGLRDAARKFKKGVKKVAKKVATGAKNTVKKAGTAAKKVVQAGKKVAVAAPRNAFLLLVQANFLGFASNLYRNDRNKAREIWKKLGGNPDKLDKAITAGAKRKPILNKNADIRGSVNGIGEVATTGAALMAAAVPVIAAMGVLLKSVAAKKDAETAALREGNINTDEMINPDNSAANDSFLDKTADFIEKTTNAVKSSAFGGSGTSPEYSGQNYRYPQETGYYQGPDYGINPGAQNYQPVKNNSGTEIPSWLIPVGVAAAALLIMKK